MDRPQDSSPRSSDTESSGGGSTSDSSSNTNTLPELSVKLSVFEDPDDLPWTLPYVLIWKRPTGLFESEELSAEHLKTQVKQRHGETCIIYDVETDCDDVKVIVVTKNRDDRFLFVNLPTTFLCLRLGPDTIADQIISSIRSITRWAPETLSYFSSGSQIDLSDVCKLPNLSTLSISQSKSVTWKFWLPCTARVEHCVRVIGSTFDSLHVMKQNFRHEIDSGYAAQLTGSASEIWFVYQNEVVTDEILRKMFGCAFSWLRLKSVERKIFNTIPLQPARHNDLEVYVYFKPRDAITKRLFVEKAPKEVQCRSMTLVISRDVTPEQLRIEISKALRQKQGALGIRVGKKRLEDVTDLPTQLCRSMSDIRITIRSHRILTFKINSRQKNITQRVLKIVHPSDTVLEVKSALSASIDVPEYKIDLSYKGQLLEGEKPIGSHGIHSKAEIDVDVHEARVRLGLRLLGGRNSSVDLLIDNINHTTVRDLKRFAKNVDPAYSSFLESEILAVFQNGVSPDGDTLSAAGLSPSLEGQKVVMKPCRSLCFSASSVALDGTFITFRARELGDFILLRTMASGPLLFSANIVVSKRDREKLLSSRKSEVSPQSLAGIGTWTGAVTVRHAPGNTCPHLFLRNEHQPPGHSPPPPLTSSSQSQNPTPQLTFPSQRPRSPPRFPSQRPPLISDPTGPQHLLTSQDAAAREEPVSEMSDRGDVSRRDDMSGRQSQTGGNAGSRRRLQETSSEGDTLPHSDDENKAEPSSSGSYNDEHPHNAASFHGTVPVETPSTTEGTLTTSGPPADSTLTTSGSPADSKLTTSADSTLTTSADSTLTTSADSILTTSADSTLTTSGPPADSTLTTSGPPADSTLTTSADSTLTTSADSTLTTSGPPADSTLTTSGPPADSTLTTSGPPADSTLTTSGPPADSTVTTSGPPADSTLTTSADSTLTTSGPPADSTVTTSGPPADSTVTTSGPPADSTLTTSADGTLTTSADSTLTTSADGTLTTSADSTLTSSGPPADSTLTTSADGTLTTSADSTLTTSGPPADSTLTTSADGTLTTSADSTLTTSADGTLTTSADSTLTTSGPPADSTMTTSGPPADSTLTTSADGTLTTSADGTLTSSGPLRKKFTRTTLIKDSMEESENEVKIHRNFTTSWSFSGLDAAHKH
ncbi:uncharacterized protein LOC143276627 [Babylonia areolata]|uniref:uncharacterized protein LOC143276627 n=1 Tax=Babylonia areolata TaxID=304850 RepID=UPI003FD46275